MSTAFRRNEIEKTNKVTNNRGIDEVLTSKELLLKRYDVVRETIDDCSIEGELNLKIYRKKRQAYTELIFWEQVMRETVIFQFIPIHFFYRMTMCENIFRTSSLTADVFTGTNDCTWSVNYLIQLINNDKWNLCQFTIQTVKGQGPETKLSVSPTHQTIRNRKSQRKFGNEGYFQVLFYLFQINHNSLKFICKFYNIDFF